MVRITRLVGMVIAPALIGCASAAGFAMMGPPQNRHLRPPRDHAGELLRARQCLRCRVGRRPRNLWCAWSNVHQVTHG